MFQVNKIEVQYDKTSKQVDVQALKGMLWDLIRESVDAPETVSILFTCLNSFCE